jgi:hypothetical protein
MDYRQLNTIDINKKADSAVYEIKMKMHELAYPLYLA